MRRTSIAIGFSIFTCSLALVTFVGCDEDDDPPIPDTSFSVTVDVRDGAGQPVAGIAAAAMAALPEGVWLPPPGGVTTPGPMTIRFTLPQTMVVRLEIRDVAGATVRHISEEVLPAGAHAVNWDGRGDAGEPLAGGWYESVLTGGGEVQQTPMFVAVCDPQWRREGATGADGRLRFTERRLVPAFWDPEPIEGITLTSATLLRLEDAAGDGMYVTFDAVDGPQTVAVTWAPTSAGFGIDLTLEVDGDPLANARVGSMPAVPGWPLAGTKQMPSRLNIPFELPRPSAVEVTVLDVTGAVVATLLDGMAAAGRHEVVWNGRDGAGDATPAGWYEIRLTATADGETDTESAGVVHAAFDPDWFAWGTTDEHGRITLTDRRLVPGFWDLPPTMLTDEMGNELGMSSLTTRTWLCVDGGFWAVLDDLEDTWQQATVEASQTPPGAGSAALVDDPIPTTVQLLPPYPNPFN